MEHIPKNAKLKDALATYMKATLVPAISSEISAPEAFRLRTLLYALLDAGAPYSDPWFAMESVMMNLTDPADSLRRLALEQIMVDCTEANVIETHKIIPSGSIKFSWFESAHKVWSCTTSYGTAKIHPPGNGVVKHILLVTPSDPKTPKYDFLSDDIRTLMNIFENRCLENLKSS